MSDLTRVNGPSSPLHGTSARIIGVVLVGITLAILKPWAGAGPEPAARSSPRPTASSAPVPSTVAIANYDPSVFGEYEPEPDWELWPAGHLVSFGFAMRIDGGTRSAAPTLPSPSGEPAPSSSGPPVAPTQDAGRPGAGRDAAGPVWPSAISITASSHLALIGVNMPLGHDVRAALWRLDDDGTSTGYPVIELPSPWPKHFVVLAMDDGSGRAPRESWPTGRYRLDLWFEPGAIAREIEIDIDAREGPAPAPVASTGAPAAP